MILTRNEERRFCRALVDFVERVASADGSKTPEEVEILPAIAQLLDAAVLMNTPAKDATEPTNKSNPDAVPHELQFLVSVGLNVLREVAKDSKRIATGLEEVFASIESNSEFLTGATRRLSREGTEGPLNEPRA